MKNTLLLCALLGIALFLNACPATYHRNQVQDDTERVTVGTVQREIRLGMSGAEVAKALGSPNIVSTDADRREVWIYDKIATVQTHSSSSGGITALLLGLGGDLTGGGGLGGNVSAGASSTSQRTLTVIIKFDDQHQVCDFAYHATQF